MKYIIMCGGNYKDKFATPKQLLTVCGEKLVERTIRLLKENGVEDIAISTQNPAFDYLDVPKLRHNNNYVHDDEERHKKSEKSWLNAYYPTEEPACYLHGDVYFSDEAIKKIVETPVKETMFFCIRDVHDGRPIGVNPKGREPLAYKVQNQKIFRKAINDLLQMLDNGEFKQDPIVWNLYRRINNLPLDLKGYGNGIFHTKGDYIAVDDYSTDIDFEKDIPKLEEFIKIVKGGIKMIRVEAIEAFHLGKFNELRNLKRKSRDVNGTLFAGDTFECTEEMTKYLTGNNAFKRAFVRVIEVIPEKQEVKEEKEVKAPIKAEKTTRTKKVAPKTKNTKKSIAKK